MENVSPVVVDMTGTDIHAEGEAIRAHRPVAEVELPIGVRAWSVTDYRDVGPQHTFIMNGRSELPVYLHGPR